MIKNQKATRHNPCPVCSATDGCLIKPDQRDANKQFVVCRTLTTSTSLNGWQFVGTAANGWGNWRESSGNDGNFDPVAKAEYLQRREEQERQRRNKILSGKNSDLRNTHYQYQVKNGALTAKDRMDLERRGLTPELIQGLEAYNGGHLGYSVPIFDVFGRRVGAQTYNPGGEGGKYLWGAEGTNHLPETLELPVTVRVSKETPNRIVLTEGTGVKPFMAAQIFRAVAIGAAGGQHASSPKDMARTLDHLYKTFGKLPIYLCPDGGAIRNTSVMQQYKKTIELLDSLGYTPQVYWWEQISKDDPDVDELSAAHTVKKLDWGEFWQIYTSTQRRMDMEFFAPPRRTPITRAQFGFKPDLVTDIDHCYQAGDDIGEIIALAAQSGAKVILDNSHAGAGKSTMVSGWGEIAGFGKQLYISQKHRHPTTAEIETSFVDFPSRHDGLYVHPERKTPAGRFWLQTQPDGEGWQCTKSNCHMAELQNELRQKGLAIDGESNPVCGACVYQQRCRLGEGDGWGYKFQREQAKQETRLRLSPNSLPATEEFDYSDALLIWDDEKVTYQNQVTANKDDVDKTALELSSTPAGVELYRKIEPLINRVRAYADGKIKQQYGFGHLDVFADIKIEGLPEILIQAINLLAPDLKEVLQCADTVDMSGWSKEDKKKFRSSLANRIMRQDANEANKKILEELPSNWLINLLTVLATGEGYVRYQNELIVNLPSNRHQQIIKTTKCSIFLDATANREDLAAAIKIKPEEVFVIAQQRPSAENVTLVQVIGCGTPTKDRRDPQIKQLKDLEDVLRTKHPDIALIDKKGMEGADFNWWSDTRGSNEMQGKSALLLIGLPVPNLGGMAAEFANLYGKAVQPNSPTPEYRRFIRRSISAEMIQGIGRLRAHRRANKALKIYWVAERDDLPFTEICAAYPGLQIETINAIDLDENLAKSSELLRLRISQAIKTQGVMTKKDLASQVGCSEANLSRLFKDIGYGFKEGSAALYKGLYSTTDAAPSELINWVNVIEKEAIDYIDDVLSSENYSEAEKAEIALTTLKNFDPPDLRGLSQGLGVNKWNQLILWARLELVKVLNNFLDENLESLEIAIGLVDNPDLIPAPTPTLNPVAEEVRWGMGRGLWWDDLSLLQFKQRAIAHMEEDFDFLMVPDHPDYLSRQINHAVAGSPEAEGFLTNLKERLQKV